MTEYSEIIEIQKLHKRGGYCTWIEDTLPFGFMVIKGWTCEKQKPFSKKTHYKKTSVC